MNRFRSASSSGFSLMELLVAAALVSILLLVAIPRYREQRLQAVRAIGTACLLEARQRLESHYARSGRYPPAGSDLSALGYGADPQACDQDGHYRLSLSVAEEVPPRYLLTAHAGGSQAADGDLLLELSPGQADPGQRLLKRHRRPDGELQDGWAFQPGH